jgi:hypothetical protein
MVMLVPVVIGLILFIAPGVYLSLTWSQAPLLILDGRARTLIPCARAKSSRATGGWKSAGPGVPLLLMMPVVLMQAAIPARRLGRVAGFVMFLVGSLWQMLVATFGTFVSAVVYQMLLNSKKNRP